MQYACKDGASVASNYCTLYRASLVEMFSL